jgi:hypothetical protein
VNFKVAQSEIVEISSQVISSIDEALSRFGQSVSSVVYWKFHFDTKLAKEDILRRPDLFGKTIRDIFKDGSFVLEQAIVNQLRMEFNLPTRNYKDLEDALNSVRLMKGSPEF